MMTSFGKDRLRALLLLPALAMMAAFLGACGYKDKPVAPQRIVPKAVTDLRYAYDEAGVTLSWSFPVKTVSGEEISEILELDFDLYRAVVPVEEYCEGCPLPFSDPISVPGGALPPEGIRTANYYVTVLRPGNLYFFKVRSRTGWWAESADSNEVSFLWYSPPTAPDHVTARPGDGFNMLSWEPVRQHRDSSPMTEPVSYQVYRSIEGQDFAKLGMPLSGTSYTDAGLENGRNYSYQVQAVNTYARGSVASSMSAVVNARPVDRTPPPLPDGLHAVGTDTGVKVFWEHAEAPDLVGYRVYRRAQGEGEARLAGTVDMPYNIFVDTEAPKARALFYSVSSIDTQNPPNESARTPEARVDL